MNPYGPYFMGYIHAKKDDLLKYTCMFIKVGNEL